MITERRDGATVTIALVEGWESPAFLEITADVVIPTDARLERTPDRLPLAGDDLQIVWQAVRAALPRISLISDGRLVRLVCPPKFDEALLDKLVLVVSRMAHWDDGLGAALLGLADARRVEDRRFVFAVSLAPDDLMIGVRDGRLVAELAGARLTPSTTTLDGGATLVVEPTRATLTWPRIERDPQALRAGVEALRTVARDGRLYR